MFQGEARRSDSLGLDATAHGVLARARLQPIFGVSRRACAEVALAALEGRTTLGPEFVEVIGTLDGDRGGCGHYITNE